MLYVWQIFVYVRETIDLHTMGCTFTRVAFFVCEWVILCLLVFYASVGVLSCPDLNGVIRILE